MAFGDIAPRIHLDGECVYHDCTADGHEVCRPVFDWIRDLREAIAQGDINAVREVFGRMKT